jgi:hypothetical protein
MTNSSLNNYEVVLNDQYYLRELVQGITLEDALGEVAYRAVIGLIVTPDFPAIAPGQKIRVSGVPYGGSSMAYLLHPGVVWDIESRTRGQKHLRVVAYDPLIYLAKSQEEYLLPAGQTAAQRLKKYAADWNISVGAISDTGIQLAKAVRRAQPIYNMVLADLRETASKGGKMFTPQMTPAGLSLFELGSNSTVWALQTETNISELTQKRTLEGTVTQVKVLGNAAEQNRSPVLAVEKGETAKYGTLQVVLQNYRITTASAGKKAAQQMLSGIQETFSVSGVDINTIRAGDTVKLNNLGLMVVSITHRLGSPGNMTLQLATPEYVRRRFYYEPY